jgi:hypothetical protein
MGRTELNSQAGAPTCRDVPLQMVFPPSLAPSSLTPASAVSGENSLCLGRASNKMHA